MSVYEIQVVSLIAAYWVLISGMTLLVGYAGQLSMGQGGLLAIGAYCYAILVGSLGWDPYVAMLSGGLLCAFAGLLLGLPSMRLPEFYFAMVTLAFSLIVSELAVAEGWLTGGGVGMPGPGFPPPFDTPLGFMALCFLIAGLATLLSWNLARSLRGRSAIALRESDVAAASVGIPVTRTKLVMFVFSGFLAGVAGALFAVSQTYITPEAFSIDLGLYFFVAIIVGGRANLLGPFLGAVLLASLPQLLGGWARYSTIGYGIVLLFVVLLLPEGFSTAIRRVADRFRRTGAAATPLEPDLAMLRATKWQAVQSGAQLEARAVSIRFDEVVALDTVSLTVRPGEVHGLIGPNGSGKTTLLNLMSGYYTADRGGIWMHDKDLTHASVQDRVFTGIARTFQTPRLVRLLTVLDNAVLGCWPRLRSGFTEAVFRTPRVAREETQFRAEARAMLEGFGLGALAGRRADVLDHGAQRLLEIARALLTRPRFLLLDEPASGLTTVEIDRLEVMLRAIRDCGIGVLLVEHHASFVFRVSDRVTALHLGRVIAHGTPQEVSQAPQVIEVYLGARAAEVHA